MSLDIVVMQAFNGLSLFTVLALMALGLAIVFGLMGVINMAHGELMAMGAYTTYLTAVIFERFMPGWLGVYLLVAIVLAFGVTFAFGLALERGFIRFFYDRPLDTMLATWGLSLILQQMAVRRVAANRGPLDPALTALHHRAHRAGRCRALPAPIPHSLGAAHSRGDAKPCDQRCGGNRHGPG